MILVLEYIVNVLEFQTLIACQEGLDKQGRPRSDCVRRSSLIRVFPVCYSDKQGRVAQSVTCLTTDARLTADPGVVSSIPARSHTFVEIDHEIISTAISSLPLIHSRRVVVSYKQKYVPELLVNRMLKLAQKKCGWVTVPHDHICRMGHKAINKQTHNFANSNPDYHPFI